MENEYGEIEEDWSETDEDSEEAAFVENNLVETEQDKIEEAYGQANKEIIRIWNRPFYKRKIKPRLGNLFTYPIDHLDSKVHKNNFDAD